MAIIHGSIVLYNTNEEMLEKAIRSFLYTDNQNNRKLFLIDHSPQDDLKKMQFLDERIIYIFNPLNPGFGSGHNLSIQESLKKGADYHVVINPDIWVDNDVIPLMVSFMEKHSDVGMLMPEILNTDGTKQYLPKLLPSPLHIVMRKLKWPKQQYRRFIQHYELRYAPDGMRYEAPILSGCYSFFRMSALKDVGSYDDRFFMYFEDWDLSRRMNQKYRTLYFPDVSVYHDYDSGANHNSKLFKIFIKSAIKYFNKWGWFVDKDRKRVNKRILKQFEAYR